MKREPEAFDEADLLIDSALLEAWPVPPPRQGSTERVLAHCAPARAELEASSTPEPKDPPVMQPTPLRHPSQRSLLMPMTLGFGAAAAMLLAFYLGRGTAPPAEPAPLAPTVELNVAAPSLPTPTPPPAPVQAHTEALVATAFANGRVEMEGKTMELAALGPAFKAAREDHDELTLLVDEALGFERVAGVLDAARAAGFEHVSIDSISTPSTDLDADLDAAARSPKAAPPPRGRAGSRRRGEINSALKNPFDGGEPPAKPGPPPAKPSDPPAKPGRAAKDPFASAADKGSSADLENPFEPDRGTLRIGTNPGEPSARVEINGHDYGQTPLVRVLLAAGDHTVIFHWPDGSSSKQQVTVKSGDSHVVRGHR